jgi:serine/threonine-protein kinase
MTLSVGTKLGVYEIAAPLGAGGMGEVYRARDTKLGRAVAVKVLPDVFAHDPDRVARFEREAKVLASLNHPHIAALYGMEEHEGRHFLVMELVEGETLGERLKKGPLPIDQVLRYAAEMADALDVAHRQGVVHRDLKPANIMLTKAGAKLLDFGLAKTVPTAVAPMVSSLPTEEPGLTVEGSILGTFQYMAPEQLEGKEADARTDLFAFGAVVYEMATGKKAFEGKSQASLIAAILEHEPQPIAVVRHASADEMAPRSLDRVVKQCLAKAPAHRWQSAHDLTMELRWIAEGSSDPALTAGRAAPTSSRREMVIRVACLLAGAIATAAAIFVIGGRRETSSRDIVRAVVPVRPANGIIMRAGERGLGARSPIAISPQGAHVVFVGLKNDMVQLYVRALNEREAKPIAGTEDGDGPFFSPDGRWVGFWVDGVLKKVSLGGGAPQTIVVAPDVRGASWGPDDMIIYPPSFTVGLARVTAGGGGTPETLTAPDAKAHEKSHRFPQTLPGGRAVLFTIGPTNVTTFDEARIAVLSLETRTWKVVIKGGTFARYVPTGHIIYARGSALLAVAFDLDRLELTGPSAAVLDGVNVSPEFGTAAYGVADDGTLVYVPASETRITSRLMAVDRKGTPQLLHETPAFLQGVSVSPDGSRMALRIGGANASVWIYEVQRKTLTRLTFREGDVLVPFWAPDGTQVTFATTHPKGLASITADGSGQEEPLVSSEHDVQGGAWAPDKQDVAFVEQHPETGFDIWILSPKDKTKRPFARTPFAEIAPRFSRDGRWMAYSSNESGRSEVYVRPFPGPGGKSQVSTSGGGTPIWSPDGGEIFYRMGTKLMAVPVTTGPTFRAGTPSVLFDGPYGGPYDVMPDGRRFVMIQTGQSSPPTHADLVLNWFVDLRRRVSAP